MEPHEKKSIFHSSPPVEPWLCYHYQLPVLYNYHPAWWQIPLCAPHLVITMMSRATGTPITVNTETLTRSQPGSSPSWQAHLKKIIQPSHLKIFGIITSPWVLIFCEQGGGRRVPHFVAYSIKISILLKIIHQYFTFRLCNLDNWNISF